MFHYNNFVANQEEAGHLLYEAIESGNENGVDELLSLTDFFPRLSQVKSRVENDEETLIYPDEHPLVLATSYPRIFEKFLLAYNEELDLFDIENSLKASAANGLWDPIDTLLKTSKVDNDCKGVALRIAVESQHANIVEKLLYFYSNQINKVYKLMSLRCALRNQNADILNVLLLDDSVIEASIHSIKSIFQQAGINFPTFEPIKPGYENIINRISNISGVNLIRKIYLECSKEHNLDNDIENKNIKNFLRENSLKIKKDYKKAALELAIEEGRIDILNALLSDVSIFEIATWNNNVTLREAKNSYIKNKENIINKLMSIPAVNLLEKAAYSHDECLPEEYIKPIDKGRALVIAAENDNIKFSQSILKAWNKQISEKYKINSLIKTIEEGNFDIFCMLLDNISLDPQQQIRPNDKGKAFIAAIEDADKKFAELMLNKWNNLIPVTYMESAIISSISRGNMEVFGMLLNDKSISDMIRNDNVVEISLRREIENQLDDAETQDIKNLYQSMIDTLNTLLSINQIEENDQASDGIKNKLK